MLFTAPRLDSAETAVLARVTDLRSSLEQHLRAPRRWTGSLRRMSLARNVQGSNSIEGINANLDDVAAVVLGEKPLEASEQTARALEGYRMAMTYVLQLAQEPPVHMSTELLRSLHFMLTSHDLAARPGRWRSGPIYVHSERTNDIVHEGAPIDDVPALMEEITVQSGRQDGPTIVAAAMAHLNLVMVHPFRDGNGRMARVLQSLVLAADGELAPVFMSIEEYLGRHTQDYYDVLAAVGGGRWNPGAPEQSRPWLRFILAAHLNQAEDFLHRIQATEAAMVELDALAATANLPDRMFDALFDAVYGLQVKRGTYIAQRRAQGEEISDLTASRDLAAMSGAGLLVAHGEKRGRSYTAGQPLIDIRNRVGLGRERARTDPFA